jgi:hypothetical protein
MAGLLIDDGMTATATIEAQGKLPALTYSYRPALPAAVHLYLHALRMGGKAADDGTVALLKAHLVSWDVQETRKSRVQGPAPITAEKLAALPFDIRERLTAKLTSYAGDEQEAAEGN